MHSEAEVTDLINEIFRRISEGGTDPVGDLFTDDGFYDGVYGQVILEGPEVITKIFRDVIPVALKDFRQWPDQIHYVEGGDVAVVEYLSYGVAERDDAVYRNKYVGVMHFEDGKISKLYEYYNPAKFNTVVGPGFQDLMERVFPEGLRMKTPEEAPWMSDHRDELPA